MSNLEIMVSLAIAEAIVQKRPFTSVKHKNEAGKFITVNYKGKNE